ncbi:MAG: hypothetical protein ACTSYB_07875 [Candidatus Helarchaeota archaeon]
MDTEKKETPNAESTIEIETMRNRLSALSMKYIKTFNKFPLVKIEGITDIKEILDKNVNFEIETRKLQKKLTRYLNSINKMLEAGINAAVLHQHFLGCFNIALQCNDLLCMKIFLSQAHSTFTEIKKYIKQYLNISKDVEKFEGEISDLLKFIRPSIDFSQKFLKLDELLLDDLEAIIIQLGELIES